MLLKRRAKEGCISSALELVDCYGQGKYGIKQDLNMFLEKSLELLGQIEEVRASEYSSALILYQIMYAYLGKNDYEKSVHYHHHLMWEIALDHPSGDLEPHFEHYQVREVAKCLQLDVEDTLEQIKAWQQRYDPQNYQVLDVNHFFTI